MLVNNMHGLYIEIAEAIIFYFSLKYLVMVRAVADTLLELRNAEVKLALP